MIIWRGRGCCRESEIMTGSIPSFGSSFFQEWFFRTEHKQYMLPGGETDASPWEYSGGQNDASNDKMCTTCT